MYYTYSQRPGEKFTFIFTSFYFSKIKVYLKKKQKNTSFMVYITIQLKNIFKYIITTLIMYL